MIRMGSLRIGPGPFVFGYFLSGPGGTHLKTAKWINPTEALSLDGSLQTPLPPEETHLQMLHMSLFSKGVYIDHKITNSLCTRPANHNRTQHMSHAARCVAESVEAHKKRNTLPVLVYFFPEAPHASNLL